MTAKPKASPTLTIRRLDPGVISALKARAQKAGRSMEEEARVILTETVEVDAGSLIEQFRELREEIGGEWDSVKMIEDARRERDRQMDEALGLPNPGADPYYDDPKS